MAVGAAYFGNRIPRHVAEDMRDLAERGFTGVLHTFSENDLAHYPGTIRRIAWVPVSPEALKQQITWGPETGIPAPEDEPLCFLLPAGPDVPRTVVRRRRRRMPRMQ